MGVDSIIEMYTFLWGWHQYNAVWDVLRETGIAYIPFFGLLLHAFMDTSLSQDPASSSMTSLKIIEVELAMMFLVIVIAVQPFMRIEMKDMEYIAICSDQIINANPNPEFQQELKETEEKKYKIISKEETQTQFKHMQMSKEFETVRVPVWLYAVYSFSSGFVQSAKRMTGCIDDITLARYAINTAIVKDSELVKELRWFANDCHFPALAKYKTKLITDPYWKIPARVNFLKSIDLDTTNDPGPTQVDFGSGLIKKHDGPWINRWEMEAWFTKADTQWMGSMILSFLYYRHLIPKTNFYNPKLTSQLSCYEIWYGYQAIDNSAHYLIWYIKDLFGNKPVKNVMGLRSKLLDAYKAEVSSLLSGKWYLEMSEQTYERIKKHLSFYETKFDVSVPFLAEYTSTSLFDLQYGSAIKLNVQNEFLRTLVNNTTPFISFHEKEAKSFRGSYTNFVKKVGLFFQGLKTSVEIKIFRDLMPMVGALTLLGITFLLPIGFVLSSYAIEFVVIASIAIFTVKLWSYLWHVAWWLEQNLWIAMNISPLSFEETKGKEDLVWFVTVSTYVALPLLFTAVLGWAGIKLGGLAQAAASGLTSAATDGAAAGANWAMTAPIRQAIRTFNEFKSLRKSQDQLKNTVHKQSKQIVKLQNQNNYLKNRQNRTGQGQQGQNQGGGSQQGGTGQGGSGSNSGGSTP